MSASLDYGIEYRPITAPKVRYGIEYRPMTAPKARKTRRYKENRRRRVVQFFLDFPNCYYCGERLIKSNRSLDHFIPRSRGGISMFTNLVTACKDCNGQKGNDLPSGLETIRSREDASLVSVGTRKRMEIILMGGGAVGSTQHFEC